MDILLLTCSIILILLGIVGSFLPVLPGPLTSWGGLLLIHYHTLVPQDNTFIWITFGVALVIFILDYFIPALGAKKFGGTKYGSYGATIGLFIGLISPIPFGILIGPFLGAYTGELINDNSNKKKALNSAIGSLIGFLGGVFIKLCASLVFLFYFCAIIWNHLVSSLLN